MAPAAAAMCDLEGGFKIASEPFEDHLFWFYFGEGVGEEGTGVSPETSRGSLDIQMSNRLWQLIFRLWTGEDGIMLGLVSFSSALQALYLIYLYL